MDIKHTKDKVYIENEKGEILAQATFPEERTGVVNIDHTLVDESLRGGAVAGKLMEEAYKEIKAQNKRAVLTCSYAVKWFERHPEYRDILEDSSNCS